MQKLPSKDDAIASIATVCNACFCRDVVASRTTTTSSFHDNHNTSILAMVWRLSEEACFQHFPCLDYNDCIHLASSNRTIPATKTCAHWRTQSNTIQNHQHHYLLREEIKTTIQITPPNNHDATSVDVEANCRNVPINPTSSVQDKNSTDDVTSIDCNCRNSTSTKPTTQTINRHIKTLTLTRFNRRKSCDETCCIWGR